MAGRPHGREDAGVPLSATLEEACRRWAPRPAITFAGATTTYGELWDRVLALASAYARLGIGRGERILSQLRNGPEQVIAIAAAWLRGAIHAGADNDLTGPELARLVERLGASALLFQPPRGRPGDLAAAGHVAAAAPGTRILVHAEDPGGFPPLAEALSSGETVAPALPAPLDPALVFLTSGTTGEPKTVIETLAAHWAKMQLFTAAFRPGAGDVMLLSLPVSHVWGVRLSLLTLLRGGRLVLLDRFSPDRTLELIGTEGVTVLPTVPTHLRLLRDRLDPARYDLRSLRWVLCAAARIPRELAEWSYATLAPRMLYVYGCSEGFTTVTTSREDILAGSVGDTVFRGPPGTPATGVVRVVDPEDAPAPPPGETGEIAYEAAVPVRHWDGPAVAGDGWYRTGDLGHVDERGRIHVTGRRKELINRGGLHVSVTEVELALARHPGLADAAVIPSADEVLGEAVCACVVPAGERAPDLAGLRGFLSGTLARHKLPDELCVLEAIPRTDIGKVDRPALRARVLGDGLARERLRP